MGRPPRAVIADALYENVAHGLTWEQWADKADDVLAALRNEYGSWRIPSGYLRTDGSEVDGTDVVIPVPAVAEETPHA